MKNYFALLIVTLALFSCSKDVLTGAGNTATQTRTVPAFHSVETHYDISADISYGATQSLQVTGYENLLNELDITVDNGVLKLKYNTRYHRVRNGNVVARIQLPALRKATTHGSGNIGITGFQNNDLATAIHGSGNINVSNSNGGRFSAAIHGSGNVDVRSAAFQNADFAINGSGAIKAQGLAAKEAVTEIQGSGDVYLTVADKLKATIRGSGNIYYWGNPVVESRIEGSGRVVKR